MKYKQWTKWTADEILEVVRMKQVGLSSKRIAKKLERSEKSIATRLWTLAYYKDNGFEYKTNKKSEVLDHVLAVLQGATASIYEPTSASVEPSDHYTELENAFKDFSNSIEQFVQTEVAIRTKDMQKEYEKIIREKDLEYKMLTEAARQSNWISSLKRKFGDVPKTF